ncbi:hypothetical protein RHGRI_014258 [Rhododendron griersonianum]|uniref:Remorin C-terminal domain-containing protein n=1 Tax=Rhododendron griersonianum TaxID=479676 RepID=A0AAV6K8N7_9ERIC|nr:hypothetical protein RHGRI_014258 [Rhododendron griersonianum]
MPSMRNKVVSGGSRRAGIIGDRGSREIILVDQRNGRHYLCERRCLVDNLKPELALEFNFYMQDPNDATAENNEILQISICSIIRYVLKIGNPPYEQEELEKKMADYAAKMLNKVALIHKEAQEKKAMVEARRGEEMLKAEELAAKHRATGTVPKKLGFLGF